MTRTFENPPHPIFGEFTFHARNALGRRLTRDLNREGLSKDPVRFEGGIVQI